MLDAFLTREALLVVLILVFGVWAGALLSFWSANTAFRVTFVISAATILGAAFSIVGA